MPFIQLIDIYMLFLSFHWRVCGRFRHFSLWMQFSFIRHTDVYILSTKWIWRLVFASSLLFLPICSGFLPAGRMKVTVCFGNTRVIVPCGNGDIPVNELVSKVYSHRLNRLVTVLLITVLPTAALLITELTKSVISLLFNIFFSCHLWEMISIILICQSISRYIVVNNPFLSRSIFKAVTRYKKAKSKNNDYWVTVHNLKSGGDGGKITSQAKFWDGSGSIVWYEGPTDAPTMTVSYT